MSEYLNEAPQGKPHFSKKVKTLGGDEVLCGDPVATRGLLAIMNMHSVIGGAASHWGGPAALAEAMSALHSIMFRESKWFDHYNFINDVGHAENGIYALRANLGYGDLTLDSLKGFRSVHSKLTGHGESHLYPEGVLLSNGPLGSSIGQAQGLAMSDCLQKNKRITVSVISDGACMEGEAKEALAAIPGLFHQKKINPFLLIVSDNNTKLSGRIDQDSFSMKPSFDSLESLGWKVVTVSEGNDLEKCYQVLEKSFQELKEGSAPIAIVLKTVKGYGVKSTMESASGGHGFPLKKGDGKLRAFLEEIFKGDLPEKFNELCLEIENKTFNNQQSDTPKSKIQAGFAKALIDLKKEGTPIVSLSSDLQGSTGASGFHKEYPDASFDLGIAESNMVSAAAGFALGGFIPVVDTFAAFGVTKGNLPLVMSRLSSCPMIALFTHTGMQDAADGASHQSTTYFSALASIPGVRILCPSSEQEAYQLLRAAGKEIQEKGRKADSFVFFAGRETYPTSLKIDCKLDKANVLKDGSDITFVASGPMVHLALEAAELLEGEGLAAEVINHSQINFPDIKTIGASVEKTKKLITIEDHQLIGGMGAMLSHALNLAGFNFKLDSVGINGHFGRSAYTAGELYSLFEMDASAIVHKAKALK